MVATMLYRFRSNRIENSGNSQGPNRGPRLILASCTTGQKKRTGVNQVGCVLGSVSKQVDHFRTPLRRIGPKAVSLRPTQQPKCSS